MKNLLRTAVVPILFAVATLPVSWAEEAWMTYNKGYDGQRYSPLKQITTRNVARLKPLCQVELSDPGLFQSGLVVVGSTLYVTTAHTTVALDAADCGVRWEHAYTPEAKEVQMVNRGVGYGDGRVFRGTGDGRVLAIDARSGREMWRVALGNPEIGEHITSAPIVWKGLVLVGMGGGDWGMRARMFALDAMTGVVRWKFNLVPEKGEPGYETWKIPETAERGGGGTWSSYSLDPETGELFVPVGNAAPMFNPDSRPGDNLYTSGFVVLDARTGKLNWYYQFLPNDGLDYDLAAAPILYTAKDGRRLVAAGSKDGYVYGVDRDSHRLVFRTAVTTVMEPRPRPTPTGVRVCPGFVGGVEWNGPAHHPALGMLFTGAVDFCNIVRVGMDEYQQGRLWHGTMADISTDERDIKAKGWVVGSDARNGDVIWKYNPESPVVAAITPTAGNLVFAGTVDGRLLAFDARDGKLLYEHQADGALAGGIITYAQKGRQLVAFISGNASRGPFFSLGVSHKLTLLALDAPPGGPRLIKVGHEFTPPPSTLRMPEHYRNYLGKKYYVEFCANCHGANGEGGIGPALRGVSDEARKDKRSIEEIIKRPAGATMPHLYPQPLGDYDVDELARFIREWK